MDEDLMFETGTKILEDRLKEADFDNIFVLFEQVCNSDDILTFTLKGYSESFQFVFDEYSYAIVFENGSCRTVKGTISLPDVTFRIHKAVALDKRPGIFGGSPHERGRGLHRIQGRRNPVYQHSGKCIG